MISPAFRMMHRRRRPAAAPPRGARPQPLLGAVALVAPLLMWLEIRLVGRLFVTELILLAAPLPRMFLLLAAMWLLSQIVTDFYRDTPFIDYSRGWSKITFTTTNFMAIYLLIYGSRQRIVLFTIGVVFGGYLSYLINPSEFALSQPWKFGVGNATIALATVLVIWPPIARTYLLPGLVIMGLGAVSLYVGSRSLAGVTIVAALYIMMQQVLARRAAVSTRFSAWRSIMFLFVGFVVTSTFIELYGVVATQGALGEVAREKFEHQSSGTFGVLLGGRSEIFISTQAIADSPLLGHGSWAKDPQYSALLLELEELGYDVNYQASESELIPTHSHLFGAWVEAGIVGAVFWLWVLFLALRVMSNLFLVREPLAPLITFTGFLLIWDVLFSPFGFDRRILMPYNIVVLMFAWETLRASVPEEALMRFRKLIPRRGAAKRQRHAQVRRPLRMGPRP